MDKKCKCPYRQARIDKGLCAYCGKKPATCGKLLCKKCVIATNKRKRDRRISKQNAGLCVECGEPRAIKSKLFCDKCRDANTKRAHDRWNKYKEAGLCICCGKNPLVSNERCRCTECILKTLAREYLGSIKHSGQLKDLFHKQDGKCVYLKSPIAIGVDASLDHIIPKSLGGEDNINNLQWVHKTVNCMKWSMTHCDFIKQVHLIAKENPR